MSAFDTLFAAGVEHLGAVTGETVTYQVSGSVDVADTAAIVGRERSMERPGKVGLEKVRQIEVSLRRSVIAQPRHSASLVIAGVTWPIKQIVSQDNTLTRVLCELPALRDSSKGGHRTQM